MGWAGRGLHGRRSGGGTGRTTWAAAQNVAHPFPSSGSWQQFGEAFLHNLQVAKESKKYYEKILQKILKTRRWRSFSCEWACKLSLMFYYMAIFATCPNEIIQLWLYKGQPRPLLYTALLPFPAAAP